MPAVGFLKSASMSSTGSFLLTYSFIVQVIANWFLQLV